MQRYFVEESLKQGQLLVLNPSDSHHLLHVMRAKPKTLVWLVDGQGLVFQGALRGVNSETRQAHIEVREVVEQEQVEMPVRVVLACGLSKHDKFESVVQKATECGMTGFIPLQLHRDVVKWNHKKAEQRISRLQKIAKEAAEQSHRTLVPHIHSLNNLDQLIDLSRTYDLKLVAFEETAKQGKHGALKHSLNRLQPGQSVLVVFGSEGGLDPKEVDKLKVAGFVCVSLGPRILRTETAPIYLLAAMSYALELSDK